jgi:hypothetical protein
MDSEQFREESKLSVYLRFGAVVLFMMFFMNPLSAWLSRVLSLPPQVEKAWLDPADASVHFDLSGKRSGVDKLNINGVFIVQTDLPSPEAARCNAEGEVIEPTHIHRKHQVWRVIWRETRPGHFSGFSPNTELDLGSFGLLATEPLPDEVLEALRQHETMLVIALDERQFSDCLIETPNAGK